TKYLPSDPCWEDYGKTQERLKSGAHVCHDDLSNEMMSALPPCVDGSELARTFLNVCSIGRCSHVFGLLARHVGPLAIMPCADQVPINSPHSRMRGGKWVVLIARSTGSALRAVCPFQPSHHAGWPARSRYAASAMGSL